MKNQSDQFEEAAKQLPLLAGDEVDEVDSPHRMADAQEDDFEDDGTTAQERSYDIPGPAWHGYVFAALPIVACMFGAGRETWSKGFITLLLALILIFFASKRKLPPIALFALLGALLAPLLSFLPANWLFKSPAWQTALVQDWDIHLSKTLTPQAAVTMEAWLFFATCCAWLAWCLTRGFSDRQRRAMIQVLTFGGVLLCLLSIFEGTKSITIPWWPRNPNEWGNAFGPFANRNHISSIAAMTCVLCASTGFDAHRRKSRLWIPCLLGFIPPVICLYMNSSRAGLILLFLGMTTWFGTIAMQRGFFKKLAVSTSLIFIISTLLVMSGGNVSKRLSEGGIAHFASDNGRSSLFVECLKMTLDSPWTGIGLGNFAAVFPQFSSLSATRFRFLHPESDLLWLLAEGGLLTVLPALLLLFWIFLSTGPWYGKKKKRKSGMQDRRLRNAAAIVFGLGVIHGLGDVPNHGLGYALFMALLAGIAIRPRRLPSAAGMPQRLAFLLAGVMLLALGTAWTAVALGHPVLPGTSAAEVLRSRAGKLADSGSPAGALPLMNQAIEMAPMDFRYYYERACLRLRLGQPKEDALLDFSRSRALDPTYALTCYTEGLVWLDYDPHYAVVGWREFLRRYPEAAPGDHGYFRGLLGYSYHYPELREPLWTLATTSELKFEFLRTVQTRDEFERCLRSLLAQQPDLRGLDPTHRENLFSMWYQYGDQVALLTALESNRKWRDDGWRILAEHYARNSDFQRACQTAIPYLPSVIRTPPGTSTDIPALERALLYNPTDAGRGIALFQAQKAQGDVDGALRTLEKVSTFPNAPAYIRQEIATLYMTKQDFRRAWENLREAMQKH
ncbi:MAG: O-antigen ligase family protein [Prosthecobacter sp.]|uniref:O-antigen ligase family protein n=1 Tax=Prosthecobacter sp. TaxID=1965333 RepID=UPI0025DA14A6|nr:O-antigen ligase family protein [Prosthecobacter sp.]MCF7786582.1 O-antigen ligase family protein [Prosthecobacter sp.]